MGQGSGAAGAGHSPVSHLRDDVVSVRLTTAFILFFPPLPSPERRVRPKCMAQRYCPLGSRLRGGPPVPPARGPPCSPGRSAQPGTRGAPGVGGVPLAPCHLLHPRACPPAPLGEAPPVPGEGSLSWWGAAGGRFGGDGPGITPTLCLPPPHTPPPCPPPSLDLSELAKAAKKKLQAVSGGQGRAGSGVGGSHPHPPHPA